MSLSLIKMFILCYQRYQLRHPNHLLEFRYLHDDFYGFDEESLIVKQDIPMHMGALRFSDEWKSDKKEDL